MATPTASLGLPKSERPSPRNRAGRRQVDARDLSISVHDVLKVESEYSLKENESMMHRKVLSRSNLRYLVMAFFFAFYKCKVQTMLLSDDIKGAATKRAVMLQRSAQHFLDCDGEDSACTYFYPTAFFDEPISPGYKFRAAAQRQLYGSQNRSFDANWIQTTNPKLPHMNKTAYPPNDFTYIHIKKAGGITMKYVMWRFAKFRKPYRAKDMFTKKSRSRHAEIGERAFIDEMRVLANTTVFYTFVRDPISRFTSAMGQLKTTSRKESYANLHCPELEQLPKASDDFAQQEMKCVLRSMKQGNEVDEHFVLATHEMYQMMFGINARVAVFPVSKISDFMKSLDVDQDSMNTASGSKSRYKNPALMEEEMVRDICTLYEPDVLVLRQVGMYVPQCDAHVHVVEPSAYKGQ